MGAAGAVAAYSGFGHHRPLKYCQSKSARSNCLMALAAGRAHLAACVNVFCIVAAACVHLCRLQGLIASFLAHFKGVAAFIETTKAAARAQGGVCTMAGRRRPIPGLASQSSRCECRMCCDWRLICNPCRCWAAALSVALF